MRTKYSEMRRTGQYSIEPYVIVVQAGVYRKSTRLPEAELSQISRTMAHFATNLQLYIELYAARTRGLYHFLMIMMLPVTASHKK